MNITIIEDTQVELDEIFHVNLKRTTGLDRMIMLDPVEAEIEILDNDCEL